MSYTLIEHDTREAWLASRRKYIGASESAAIFGVGYADQSAFSVWAQKTGRIQPSEDEADRLRIGQLIEPALRKLAEWKIGQEVWHHSDALWVSTSTPWLAASLDGFLAPDNSPIQPVELKNVGQWGASDWSGDEIPLKFAVQVQHQLAVTGADVGYLFGLIGGQRAEVRTIERNQGFIDAMLERLGEFWRCVETDTPPEVDGSAATSKALAKLHPQDNGRAVALPADLAGASTELALVKAEIKALEARESEIENRIKAAIGSATYGKAGATVFSWKTQTNPETVRKASTFRVLRTIKALPKGVLIESPLHCGAALPESLLQEV